MLILDVLPFEDRATLAVVDSRFRRLALWTMSRLKVMKDLPCLSLLAVTVTLIDGLSLFSFSRKYFIS